jgi:hypothetical protein
MLEVVAAAAAATVNEASLKGILRNGGAVKAYRMLCEGERNTDLFFAYVRFQTGVELFYRRAT